MRAAMVLIATLGALGCSDRATPPPTNTGPRSPAPTALTPKERARQFAAAWADTLERAAKRACECADDGCRARVWMPAMVWLRDAFDGDDGAELELEITGCDEQRLVWARGVLDRCASRSERERAAGLTARDRGAPSCDPAPAPEVVAVDRWWESPDPCPANTELETTTLGPPFSMVFRARCADDGVEQGRYSSFHLNGSLFVDGNYADGERVGRWRHHYLHGLLASEEDWVAGLRQGDVRRVYRNGARKASGSMHHGARYGRWTEWKPDGSIKSDAYYQDGEEITRERWESTGEAELCMLDCRQAPRVSPSYSVTAKQNLDKADAAVAAGDWELAVAYFEFIISRFPASRYRALAEAGVRKGAPEIDRLRAACVTDCDRCEASCSAAVDCRASCSTRYSLPSPPRSP